jgi:hypothetical protein
MVCLGVYVCCSNFRSRVLVNSTLLLSTPELPFYPLSGTHFQSLCTFTNRGPNAEARMKILDDASLKPWITSSLYELAAYTVSIESYIRGDTLRLDAQSMCDRRNLAQYNLMCIAPESGLEEENALSEICRIGAIIYSIGVTFPLAGVGAPFPKLAMMLQWEIQNSGILDKQPLLPTTYHLLLWVLTMGGIAAAGRPERTWYTIVLANTMTQCQVTDWRDLKNLLMVILWLDSACDMAGRELWSEARSQMQRTSVLSATERSSPCAHCKARKVKCGNERPCYHCISSGLDCQSLLPEGDKERVHVYSVRRKPCELCKRRRVRCDKGSPCQRCLNGGYDCTYADHSYIQKN